MGRLFTIKEYAEYKTNQFYRAMNVFESYIRALNPNMDKDSIKFYAMDRVMKEMPELLSEERDPMFWKHALGLHGKVMDNIESLSIK